LAERYIDVNVFVYWLGGHPELSEKAAEWLRQARISKRGSYATSTLTIYETLVVLAGLRGASLKDWNFVKHVLKAFEALGDRVHYEPLTFEDFKRGLEIMMTYRLDFEDALHIACALRLGVKEIISNDRDFDKVREIRRIF